MQRRDAPHDRPAEAAAALFVAGHAEEAFAQAGTLGLAEPGAAVFHGEVHPAGLRLHLHAHLGRGGAVAQRVVQQVAREHREQDRVARHQAGRLGQVQFECLVAGQGRGGQLGGHLAGQLGQVHRVGAGPFGVGAREGGEQNLFLVIGQRF